MTQTTINNNGQSLGVITTFSEELLSSTPAADSHVSCLKPHAMDLFLRVLLSSDIVPIS